MDGGKVIDYFCRIYFKLSLLKLKLDCQKSSEEYPGALDKVNEKAGFLIRLCAT